jgi:aquaporin Z
MMRSTAVPVFSEPANEGRGIFSEAWGTFLGTASGARNVGSNGALAIGGYIVLAGFWAAPISGASMNSFRSLGPDLVRGDMSTTFIYIAGPCIGALIAVGFEWILKGKATAAGTSAAQGEL